MRRKKEDAEITRKQILDAGLNLFSCKGYARTTLNDIAKAAEVTRGAIYWHFQGKSEIYSILVEEKLSKATYVIREILLKNISPRDKIRQFLVTSIKYVEEDADYRAIMHLTLFKTEVIDEVEEMINTKKERTKKTISEIATIIEEGIIQGQFRKDLNSQSVAIAVLGLINGMISLWMLNKHYFSINQHIDNIVDQFMRGLIE